MPVRGELREGNSCQDTDDRNNDQQLDQGKAVSGSVKHNVISHEDLADHAVLQEVVALFYMVLSLLWRQILTYPVLISVSSGFLINFNDQIIIMHRKQNIEPHLVAPPAGIRYHPTL